MEPDAIEMPLEAVKKPSRARKPRVVPIRIVKQKKTPKAPKSPKIPAQTKKRTVSKKGAIAPQSVISIPLHAQMVGTEASTVDTSFADGNKKKPFLLLIVINIVGLAFIAGVSWYIYRDPIQEIQSPTAPIVDSTVTFGEVSSSTPETLIIPSIELNAHIVPVGKTKAGNMNVPADFGNVGWYKYGALPGRSGNAVIDGHFDNGKGQSAVFYNLSRMRVGDSVFVINKDGQKIQFKVKEISLVSVDELQSDKVFGNTTDMNLNLITCDGVWMPDRKTYTERLVVFTERVLEGNE
jgi:LPXTG-site transpeptidase (sortase) family protein